MSKSGKYYWVLTHVTPSYNAKGELDGYHSNRRKPQQKAVKVVEALYASLLAEEKKHDNAKTGLDASVAMLMKLLSDQNLSYSEFVWSVGE